MSLELQARRTRPSTHVTEEVAGPTQVLPPTDRGSAAWKYLFGSFVIEALLWGFPLNFGVFQDYYTRQPEFERSPNIAVIGVVSTSVYFLGAPFASPLVKRFQHHQRMMILTGWIMCISALVAASFVSSVSGLIATQGVLYGLGYSLVYFPVLRMLDEWFIHRRGLAYGLLYAGAGFSGAGLPFLLEILLSKFGYRTTLRTVAVAQFVLVLPIIPLLKGRLPPSRHGSLRMVDLQFLQQPLFYCLALSNMFQGFGFFIPSLYLPTFASELGLSASMGALILAVFNIATILGQVSFGYISDHFQNVLILVFISSFASSIAAFTIWGFAHSLGTLLVFSLVYGWSAGAFVVFWPKFGSILADDPQPVYSMMAFGKGIGNITTGPVSALLLTQPVAHGYGLGKFRPLILYLGTCMLCSSLGALGAPLMRRNGPGSSTRLASTEDT